MDEMRNSYCEHHAADAAEVAVLGDALDRKKAHRERGELEGQQHGAGAYLKPCPKSMRGH